MKWNIVVLFIVIVFLAGLDIKNRGFFFQRLPCSTQKYLATVFKHEAYCCSCRCSTNKSETPLKAVNENTELNNIPPFKDVMEDYS